MLTLAPPVVYTIIEGIDKCGKSSIFKALGYVNLWWGLNALITYEPYDKEENPKGYETRQILKGQLPNPGFLELQRDYFVPGRQWLIVNKLTPAIRERRPIWSDRSYLSTMVFGKTSGNIPYKTVFGWHKGWCYYPTQTILVDISAKESMRRNQLDIEARGGCDGDIFDQEGMHKQARRRAAYLELVDIGQPYVSNPVVINGEQSKEAVLTDVLKIMADHLHDRVGFKPDGSYQLMAHNAIEMVKINR